MEPAVSNNLTKEFAMRKVGYTRGSVLRQAIPRLKAGVGVST